MPRAVSMHDEPCSPNAQTGDMPDSQTSSPLTNVRIRTFQLALFGLFLSTYAYFSSAAQWNENSRFDLTRSVVERGRLDIDPYHVNTQDKAYYRGHYYCDKAPGVSFLAVPAYAGLYALRHAVGKELPRQWVERTTGEPDPVTGRPLLHPIMRYNAAYKRGLYFSNLLANALPAALAVALLFGFIARRRPHTIGAAFFAAIAYGLGSLAFPYATLFYGHQAAGSILLITFIWALHAPPDGPPKPWWHEAVMGFLLALAVAIEYPAALASIVVGVVILMRSSRRAATVAFLAAGALLPAVALALYHNACFGGPFSLGYQHLANKQFAQGMSKGLVGITIPNPIVLLRILAGPHRGLLYQSPVLVLVPMGIAVLWRRHQMEAIAITAVITAFLLLNASYYMWDGGAALGPRHMIPSLGLAAVALGYAYPSQPGRAASWTRGLVWTAAVISMANMLAATAVGPEAPLGVFDPLTAYIWPHFLHGELALNIASSNVGLNMHLPGLVSLVPLVVLWTGAAVALAWVVKKD